MAKNTPRQISSFIIDNWNNPEKLNDLLGQKHLNCVMYWGPEGQEKTHKAYIYSDHKVIHGIRTELIGSGLVVEVGDCVIARAWDDQRGQRFLGE